MTDDKKPAAPPKDTAPKDDTDALRSTARPGGLTKAGPDSQDQIGKKRIGG